MKTVKRRMTEMNERPDSGFTMTELAVACTVILIITAIFTRVIAGDQPNVWQGMAVAAAASIVVLGVTLAVNYLLGRKKSVSDRLAAMGKNPEGGMTSSEMAAGAVGVMFLILIFLMVFN